MLMCGSATVCSYTPRLQLLKSTTGVTMMTPSQDVCCSISNILQTSSQCQCNNLEVSDCQFPAASYLLICKFFESVQYVIRHVLLIYKLKMNV